MDGRKNPASPGRSPATLGRSPAHPELSLTEQELFQRLSWFTQVRWGAVACAALFMAVGWYLCDVRFAWPLAMAVVAAMAVYNLVFWIEARRLYRRPRLKPAWVTRLAHAQIACDLLAVAALVHAIGGVENHFIILFIFPLVVASEFFSQRVAILYATAAAVLINAIGWGEYFFYDSAHHPLQVLSVNGGRPVPLVAPGAAQHSVFVLQVCFVMTFAVYITVFVVGSIAGRLRRREEELARAHRQLQSLEEIKSQFMRKTSHELRAPVGAIQSLLKAALSRAKPDIEGRALVDRAILRSENMLDLIDDLLLYSRLQAAEGLDKTEPVDLAGIVLPAVELFRAQAEEKKVTLDVWAESARVLGFRESLKDMVDNLISNALRYTPPGGRVTVETAADGDRSILVVADTGIGIPADEQPHIFDEFFRGQTAKETVPHGTGLGMTIVKRVVDMHAGRIDVESAAGRGTTFRVHLPRLPDVG